jgi:hypothetical protein
MRDEADVHANEHLGAPGPLRSLAIGFLLQSSFPIPAVRTKRSIFNDELTGWRTERTLLDPVRGRSGACRATFK